MKRSIAPIGAVALLLALPGGPLCAQGFPAISQRMFTDGSARVTVTGAFSFNEDVAINKQASFSGGDMTWLQFGASGGPETNATITYNQDSKETGIIVARGKLTATGGIAPGEPSECTGRVEVSATLMAGRYSCRGVTSYDPATGKMGKVDIDISFTAKS